MTAGPTRSGSDRPLRVSVVGAASVGRAATGLATWLERAAPRSARGLVAIALLPDARVRALNRQHRKLDEPTDVLSFPAIGTSAHEASRPPQRGGKSFSHNELGDIAIAIGVARRQARDFRHTLGTELRVLALHGLLHLLGYDHDRDEGDMERVEERLRRRAGLQTGLIARASRTSRRA